MISKKTVNALLVSAVALTVAGGASLAHAQDAAAPATEKCYGVAKAGKNDCANSAKSHSCAGQAAADADHGDFVNVPAGLCDKLVGGSLTEAAPAAEAAPAEAAH